MQIQKWGFGINASYMTDRLVEHKVLHSCSFTDMCRHVVCDTNSKLYMYGECSQYKDKKKAPPEGIDPGKQIWVYSWQNKIEERAVHRSDGQSDIRFRVSVTERKREHSILFISLWELVN